MVGPLHFEPTDAVLEIPPGDGPVVVVAPSTATTGTRGLAELALETLTPGEVLPEGSGWWCHDSAAPTSTVPPWAVVGLGRQDELLSHADLVICGGGHGMVSKTLLAGVPMVVVPGGGDQWEIANRVVRQGSARLIRPLDRRGVVGRGQDVLGVAALPRGRPPGGRQPRRSRRSGTGVPRSARAVSVGWALCG